MSRKQITVKLANIWETYIFRVVVVLKKWKQVFPLDYFKAMTIHLLNDYLSSRGGINQTGNKETLAKNAFYAYSLNLPVNKSEEEETQCYQNGKKDKLVVNGFSFPEPKSLASRLVYGVNLLSKHQNLRKLQYIWKTKMQERHSVVVEVYLTRSMSRRCDTILFRNM